MTLPLHAPFDAGLPIQMGIDRKPNREELTPNTLWKLAYFRNYKLVLMQTDSVDFSNRDQYSLTAGVNSAEKIIINKSTVEVKINLQSLCSLDR